MPKLSYSKNTVDWVRPADWLPLPTITASDSKFAGLLAISNNDSNFIALTATGNFTVDWGDGSATENISSGVTAQHQYTYSSISSTTLCSRGYKQVVVTIVPNGGSLVSVNLQKRHSSASAFAQLAPWLDIAISLTAGAASRALTLSSTSVTIRFNLLEAVNLYNTETITNLSGLFYQCYLLQYVNLFSTVACTNASYLFYGCSSLLTVPSFNFTAVTNASYMFAACYILNTTPAFTFTSQLTNASFMFYQCYSLKTCALFYTNSVTNFTSMFQFCRVILSIPNFVTTSGTNFTDMFRDCYSIFELPAINVASALSANLATLVLNSVSITKSGLIGTAVDISYASCNLSATELNAIYTALATATKTITVTGNYGSASDDPTIATAKGWTVTG